MRAIRSLPLLLVAFTAACGGAGGGGGDDDDDMSDATTPRPDGTPPTPGGLFSPQVTSIVLEVDYQTGAAPHTGTVVGATDIWDLFRANAERIFLNAGKQLVVPSTLGEMEQLAELTGTSFTAQAILDVAALHQQARSTATSAAFYVLFLDGYYNDGATDRMDVLGVSIGGTGVFAMFKPVIDGSDTPIFPTTSPYVEQTVLVHEFGHAVGLVANGVPTTSAHEDTAHPRHCTNQQCVLYFQNDGAAGMIDFVRNSVTTGNTILLDDSCLADTDALIAQSKRSW